jgi:hypothetical protein
MKVSTLQGINKKKQLIVEYAVLTGVKSYIVWDIEPFSQMKVNYPYEKHNKV